MFWILEDIFSKFKYLKKLKMYHKIHRKTLEKHGTNQRTNIIRDKSLQKNFTETWTKKVANDCFMTLLVWKFQKMFRISILYNAVKLIDLSLVALVVGHVVIVLVFMMFLLLRRPKTFNFALKDSKSLQSNNF
jgi:hypothetical protein